jgi:hypothetical protein
LAEKTKNKMRKTIILGMYVLTVLTFGACTKAKDGAPGAQGPQGTQGNANVQSFTSTTNNGSWTLSNGEYDAYLSVPAITQDILDKGTVNIFASDGSGGYTALPFSVAGMAINYTMSVGTINIQVTMNDGTNPPNIGANTFKVVVIAGKSMATHSNVNFTNYNELKKTFNLKD